MGKLRIGVRVRAGGGVAAHTQWKFQENIQLSVSGNGLITVCWKDMFIQTIEWPDDSNGTVSISQSILQDKILDK